MGKALYRVRAVRRDPIPSSLPYRTAEGAVIHLEVEPAEAG